MWLRTRTIKITNSPRFYRRRCRRRINIFHECTWSWARWAPFLCENWSAVIDFKETVLVENFENLFWNSFIGTFLSNYARNGNNHKYSSSKIPSDKSYNYFFILFHITSHTFSKRVTQKRNRKYNSHTSRR